MRGWPIVATDDGSKTLRHPGFDELLHSDSGALQEARHVFLETSLASTRLNDGEPMRVFEVGFGTGLNFLVTADCTIAARAPLEYDAVDVEWPDGDVLRELGYGAFLKSEHLWDDYLIWCDTLAANTSPTQRVAFQRDIALTHRRCDARVLELRPGTYDAIYLDAFSPGSHPDLWTEPFLVKLAQGLAEDGCISTYSCKGSVRRALETAGLTCERVPGIGRKREILRARKIS